MKAGAQTLVIDPTETARREPVKPFPLRFAADLVAAPAPVSWLIPGVLERNAVGMLVGASTAGKSLVAIDQAASVASASNWYTGAVHAGPVVYLAGEGHRGINRRLCAWSIAKGISLQDVPLVLSECAVNLTDACELARVAASVDEVASRVGAPVLIIVDTLHRHFEGDENDAADIGRLLHHLNLLREPYHAALLLVHHTGHASPDRARGTSSLRPTLDSEVLVSRDDRTATLRSMKQKDADPFETLAFEICTVDLPEAWNDEHGRITTSAILRPTLEPATHALPPLLGGNQRKAYDTLRRLYDEHGERLRADGREGDAPRVLIDDWRASTGLDRHRWRQVSEGLVKAQRVRLEHPYAYLMERTK